MSEILKNTKAFLERRCLANCEHNANESCICQIALCLKEIENAEKDSQIVDLIFKKQVVTLLLELAGNVDEYNERIGINAYKLTEDEFNTLKEKVK